MLIERSSFHPILKDAADLGLAKVRMMLVC